MNRCSPNACTFAAAPDIARLSQLVGFGRFGGPLVLCELAQAEHVYAAHTFVDGFGGFAGRWHLGGSLVAAARRTAPAA